MPWRRAVEPTAGHAVSAAVSMRSAQKCSSVVGDASSVRTDERSDARSCGESAARCAWSARWTRNESCLLYTSPSPRDAHES
eukprot:689118-Prymnesium_polylepis.1